LDVFNFQHWSQLCHEIGLSGDAIHFFLASLDIDMDKPEKQKREKSTAEQVFFFVLSVFL
jgi:hypothetical protein